VTASVTRRLRVLVANDDRLFLKRLMNALGDQGHAEVVGYACDGQDAVDLAIALQPDVVVMSMHLPGIGGTEATRRIRTALPLSSVLATAREGAEQAGQIHSAGAVGLMKEDGSSAALIGLSVALAAVMAELERARPARAQD
jgi:DNA-binding NarL/FixJ family response regulator